MSDANLSAKLEELSQCKEIETVCIGLVYEFLICNNFITTANAFTEELKTSLFSRPDVLPTKKERIEKDDVIKIISAMEMEDHLQFFERWTELIPLTIKNLPEYKNITLPLYTYFATLPLRKEKQTNSNIEDNNQTLKLEDVSGTDEESIKGNSILNSGKIHSFDVTFVIDNTVDSASEIGSASERDPDIEPDSLESEAEYSDTDRKKGKIQLDIKKEVNDAVVVHDQLQKNEEKEINDNKDEQTPVSEDQAEEKKSDENGSTPSAMIMFQEFLLEKKYSFNTEPQYLPLFALPFIQNPKEHEAFNQLFQDKWVCDLKESLHSFLIKFSCGDSVVPDIVKIYKEYKQLQSSLKKSTEYNEDYSKLYKESRRKLHKLKRDHKNLVGVASELATALENSVRGEAVDINTTLSKCVTIFPDLFPHTKGSALLIRNGDVVKSEKERIWIGPSQLDTKKIKEDLTNASIKTQLLLLQALRWEVWSARCEDRETMVGWLSREDILGLEGVNGYGREWLSSSEAHPLQQSIARLLNCVASLRTGRDYIVECSPPLVPVIVESVVRGSCQDRLTLDMLVALLQKLSLRKETCDQLIKHGLLDWLATHLPQTNSLYQLEYTSSLFMNLSIHAPVAYWDKRPHQILPTLLKLLKTPHAQVLEFLLGSLYCLLRSDKLNIFARSLGLSSELAEISSVQCQRQVSALLKLHRRELSPAAVQLAPPQATEEDIEDPEEIEAEVNAEDLVKGTLSGNLLLAQHYSLLFTTPSIVGRTSEDRLRLRPSTPRALHSLPAWAM